MNPALRYLLWTSFKNAVRTRLQRLREPRYLIGALFVLGYLWAYSGFKTFRRPGTSGFEVGDHSVIQLALESGVVLALFLVVMTYAWAIREEEAGLRFSEAEIGFLFPAPLTRRALVRFHLLRTQSRLAISSFAVTLFSLRLVASPEHALTRFIGTWLIFSAISFHSLAAGFTRQSLALRGVSQTVQRVVFALAMLTFLGISARAVQLSDRAYENADDVAEAMVAFTGAAPVSWVVGPILAAKNAAAPTDVAGTLFAFGLLSVALFAWVTQSVGRFEEATLARAQKVALRLSAAKSGQRTPRKANAEPFRLASTGSPLVAFIWSGLISSGRWARPSIVLGVPTLLFVTTWALVSNPNTEIIGEVVATVCLFTSFFMTLVGPIMARGGVPRLFERIELVKSLPVRGALVILGEMMPTVLLLVWLQWTGCCAGLLFNGYDAPFPVVTGVVCLMVFGPAVTAFLTVVPFGIALFFPGWVATKNDAPRGFEAIGQRLLFRFVFLLLLVIGVLPGSALAFGVGFALSLINVPLEVCAVVGTLIATTVMVAEVGVMLVALGRRYERFDFSKELW